MWGLFPMRLRDRNAGTRCWGCSLERGAKEREPVIHAAYFHQISCITWVLGSCRLHVDRHGRSSQVGPGSYINPDDLKLKNGTPAPFATTEARDLSGVCSVRLCSDVWVRP